MRRVASLVLLLVALPATAQAATHPGRPAPVPAPFAHHASPQRAAAPAPAAATAGLKPCADIQSSLCGQVSVPLDRTRPNGTKIGIFFRVFPARDPSQPKLEPIFATGGGPGFSFTQGTGDFLTNFFGPLLGRRDLVLIDQRGVGLSGAIDCPALQGGPDDIYAAAAACGRQLGPKSDLYGSADVAEDIDAVRAALGADKFDFYGGSYAAVDVQAYAVRHPDHLRAVVLDSPFPLTGFAPFYADTAKATVRTVVRICGHSPTCAREHPNPTAEIEALIARVRAQPVDGVGYDPFGEPHDIHLDEPTLLKILQSDNGGLTTQSELLAAAQALRAGDPVPILRLAAESPGPLIDFGNDPPTVFSVGDNLARLCTDTTFQWDKSAAPADRRAQFEAARAALAPGTFAPFSVDAWMSPPPEGAMPDPCIGWPAPTHGVAPPIPAGAHVAVPALILTGDLDFNVPTKSALRVRDVFPHSVLVELASSGHQTAANARNNDCAWPLIQDFLDDLALRTTRCARDEVFHFPAVGVFPRFASQAREALVLDPNENQAGPADRRIATVAAATVTDAFRRLFIAGPEQGGRGLRSGFVNGDFDDTGASIDIALDHFTEDVAVTGRGRYDFETSTIDGNFALSGPGLFAQVEISGPWFTDRADFLTIDGQINGRRAVLRVRSG